MPQTSDELRELMIKWFGDMSDYGPLKLLMAKGWTDKGGMLFPPTPSYWGPREDYVLLKFLREEWDYDYTCVGLTEGLC